MMYSHSTAIRPFNVRAASLLVLATTLVLGACGGGNGAGDTADTAADTGMSGMEGHDVGAMDGTMTMSPDVMQRHAAEMDSMADRVRDHVAEMRQLTPAEWHASMDRHAPLVANMLTMLSRQMSEMDMGMNMDADHMGEMMGMSGQEHDAMMQEMATLRTEVGELQTAAPDDVRAQMPAHLERLERMVRMMEATAEHMGRM